MLTEQKLKAFEESSAASEADGEQWVGIHIDDLAQLIAAARVANAAERVERERQDAVGRTPVTSMSKYGPLTDDARFHLRRARADLARALRHYMATRPAEVAT